MGEFYVHKLYLNKNIIRGGNLHKIGPPKNHILSSGDGTGEFLFLGMNF